MELSKTNWNKNDIPVFQKFLKSFEKKQKKEWAINLLKTSLPVLCITTKDMKKIIDDIYKGNYIEFLNLMIWEYYENTAINGFLICRITDFNEMKKYLDIYSSKADNWATCDLLKFDVQGQENNFLNLAKEYIKSEKPFKRRIGMYVLFSFINDKYIDTIFNLLNLFEYEENYYVNMMNGWLLSECFIKQRDKTLEYFKNNKLNKTAINKGIQKCRESRRVNLEDKNMLLKYKKK